MWGEPKDKAPLQDDVPKHRKRAEINTPKKADHKHDYVHVLVRRQYTRTDFVSGTRIPLPMISHGTQCSICGKIGHLSYEKLREMGYETLWENYGDNLPEKYPELMVVDVEGRL